MLYKTLTNNVPRLIKMEETGVDEEIDTYDSIYDGSQVYMGEANYQVMRDVRWPDGMDVSTFLV